MRGREVEGEFKGDIQPFKAAERGAIFSPEQVDTEEEKKMTEEIRG